MSRSRRLWISTIAVLSLLAAACGDDGGDPDEADGENRADASVAGGPNPPPANPFLADSVVPVGHFDSAQSDSLAVAGPTGPTATLGEDQLQYQHLGPAHFGIAVSPEYPNGERVIWSNGGDRISKLDYQTLEVLAELPLPGKDLLSEADADAHIADLDAAEGRDMADLGVQLAAEFLTGLSGVYYLLDADNTLFVGGSDAIFAYRDVDPGDPASEIEQRDEWPVPDDVGGSFVGANLTFDGRIVMVTNEGWVVVVERDFSEYEAIQLVGGAEEAVAHNEAMEADGRRSGSADWVRNSVAVDEDGGIYVASAEHMHKVVWDGASLSTDPADGAWTEPYLSTLDAGTGATPSLMGFGDEDRFVVITDGEELMNVVLFWRDEIPEDAESVDGAPSDRIAGMAAADMGDPDLEAIQTDQSVVVGGNGAFVVNNDPASIPDDFPPAGLRVLAGFAGSAPEFTPHGVQKFEWDAESGTFAEAWANPDVSSANSVPVVSTGSNIVYTVGARDGDWTLEGIDWETGESAFHYVTGSGRYNSLFSGINLDAEGRVIHTTAFGIVRYLPDE